MPGPSLERIGALAQLLDHPERTYPSIQITGTNGKTTTAAVLTRLACAHGLSTGTFLSPHLASVTERLSVCGVEMTVAEFDEEYERLLPFLRTIDERVGAVTYFEALTALAYLWFADKPVALGVFEVGMGGSWDATNLVRGEVAVIAPIGLDHTNILGSTVEAIAGEKAGVVKEGATAVLREQRPGALEVIRSRARHVGATLLLEGEDFALTGRERAVGGQLVSVRGTHASYEDFFLPLFGEQAARNTACALVALESLLGRALDPAAVGAALGSASVPGRLEVASRGPLVVLDGAHNPDAATALLEALGESFTWERLHLVAGMADDKDVEGVLSLLAPSVDAAYACRPSGSRGSAPERVAAALLAAGVRDVETYATVAGALEAARAAAGEGDLILVTGSFYTVGEARPLLAGDLPPPSL